VVTSLIRPVAVLLVLAPAFWLLTPDEDAAPIEGACRYFGTDRYKDFAPAAWAQGKAWAPARQIIMF
jgi:hypothetical protein